ncbi:hypothetical protein [Ammoniphilus sp. YIM 78166]|uniref:hypothetical protein n=1 Tax=Ammoniphilus sp. YIM 78166 TaxID=1644106 RepID=UPI00106FDA91|nr:hypothetical protein [Ammoniphilus sp. YIM 78166]
MKWLKILGWLSIPYIMIMFQWKQLGSVGRGLGTLWALFVLLIAISTNSSEPQQENAILASAPANQKAETEANANKEQQSDVQDKEAVKQPERETPPQTEMLQYKIGKIGDLSVGNAVRLEYWIVTDPMITEEQIKKIANEVVEKAKKEKKFNAMVLWFIDDGRQINNGYTVAKVEYSPNGVWEDAIHVKTGDYSKHKFVYHMGSALTGKLPKDNENYPTKEELDLYFAYKVLMDSKESPIHEEMPLDTKDVIKWIKENRDRSDAYEKDVMSKIAIQYNIPLEKLEEIILKASVR